MLHEGLWGLSFGLIFPFTVMQQALLDMGGNTQMAGVLAAFLFGMATDAIGPETGLMLSDSSRSIC